MLAKLQTHIQQCQFLPRWIPGRMKIVYWAERTRGEARGPELLCNRSDAKWSAVWRGHLRPAHLDNELRCNPKLRRTAVYPPRSPSLVLSHQSPLQLHIFMPSLVPELIFPPQPDLSLHVILPIFWLTPSLSVSVSLSSDAFPFWASPC